MCGQWQNFTSFSKHMHDVPDYKCNYENYHDSWKMCPTLLCQELFFWEKQAKASSSEHVWRFHKVRRLTLHQQLNPLTFSLNHLMIQDGCWSSCHSSCDSQQKRQKKLKREKRREGVPIFLKTLQKILIWHSCLYLIFLPKLGPWPQAAESLGKCQQL